MPIILILLLTASCARLPWPAPPFGFGGSGSLALTAFAFLLPIGAALTLSRWAATSLRAEPDRRPEIAARYGRYRRLLGYVNLLAAVVAVVGLGWGWTVWNRVIFPDDGPAVAPLAELLVPAPYLLTVFASWLVYYDVERLLHTRGQADRSFWSRAGYFFYNFRSFGFLVLVPVLLYACQGTILRLFPDTANGWIGQLFGLLMVPAMFVVLPLLIRPMLGLRPLPPGPTRDRLEAIGRERGFRCANLLTWPTRGSMANAMVVGVVPWARYVVFTDRLLDSLAPDELDAVFGHEVGHAKHWHIPYYLLFLLLSAVAVGFGVELLMLALADRGWLDLGLLKPWAGLPELAALLVYLFFVFGFLSRQCERQADLYGCRVAGTDAMMRALARVADLNGFDARTGTAEHPSLWVRLWSLLRAWQHGPIHERIRFLAVIRDRPDLEPGVQRRVYRLRWGLVVWLLAVTIGLAYLIGWKEMTPTM